MSKSKSYADLDYRPFGQILPTAKFGIMSTKTKLESLKNILKNLGSVVVAFSGGVDSTFLLKMAKDTLGQRVLAVTAVSETYPRKEKALAVKLARQMGVTHTLIRTEELANTNFYRNPENRCFFCKKELFAKLKKIAARKNLRYVVDATTCDDLNDFRPGRIAATELGVRSPLLEARFSKDDVRQVSRWLRLSTWNRPAQACLASRIPYGEKISAKRLARIERAEEYLSALGFKQLRVRDHNNLARIEVEKKMIKKVLEHMPRITAKFKQLGFDYVTLDLEGFRSGSMNRNLRGVK